MLTSARAETSGRSVPLRRVVYGRDGPTGLLQEQLARQESIHRITSGTHHG
jgi:hypothetical protein